MTLSFLLYPGFSFFFVGILLAWTMYWFIKLSVQKNLLLDQLTLNFVTIYT